jgi:hypothetical protein
MDDIQILDNQYNDNNNDNDNDQQESDDDDGDDGADDEVNDDDEQHNNLKQESTNNQQPIPYKRKRAPPRKPGDLPRKLGRPRGSKTLHRSGLPRRKPARINPKAAANAGLLSPQFVEFIPPTTTSSRDKNNPLSKFPHMNQSRKLQDVIPLIREKLQVASNLSPNNNTSIMGGKRSQEQLLQSPNTILVTGRWKIPKIQSSITSVPPTPTPTPHIVLQVENSNNQPIIHHNIPATIENTSVFVSFNMLKHNLIHQIIINSKHPVAVKELIKDELDTSPIICPIKTKSTTQLLWEIISQHPNIEVINNTTPIEGEILQTMSIQQAKTLDVKFVVKPQVWQIQEIIQSKLQPQHQNSSIPSSNHNTATTTTTQSSYQQQYPTTNISYYNANQQKQFQLIIPTSTTNKNDNTILDQIITVQTTEQQILQIIHQHIAVPLDCLSPWNNNFSELDEIIHAMHVEGQISIRNLHEGIWLCDVTRSNEEITQSIFLSRKNTSWCFATDGDEDRQLRICRIWSPIPTLRMITSTLLSSPSLSENVIDNKIIRAVRRGLVIRHFCTSMTLTDEDGNNNILKSLTFEQVTKCLWELVHVGWAIVLPGVHPLQAPPAQTPWQLLKRFSPSPAVVSFLLPKFRDPILVELRKSHPNKLANISTFLSFIGNQTKGDEIWTLHNGQPLQFILLSLLDHYHHQMITLSHQQQYNFQQEFECVIGMHDTKLIWDYIRTLI